MSRRSGGWLIAALAMLAAWAPAVAAVEVQARIGRRALSVGETTTLEVVVRGAGQAISDPEFTVPTGVEVLGTGRIQNFSWTNGRSSAETVFRFEIAPNAAGRFTLGPVRVRVGGQMFESPAIEITVTAASRAVGEAGNGPASLVADVSPREPYVGQPVVLRVRLVQRAPLAEDPQYTPPATPGFWAERFSDPESYYGAQGPRRVLVTETRARLYPLAQGIARIGEAAATVTLAAPGPFADPLLWLGGPAPRREMVLKSTPVSVRVRPLPAGAPAGFDGAIGEYGVTFRADRTRTSQDVPLTVRLEVRGVGNLPLLHTPALSSRDFELFAGTVEDSLGPPGTAGAGRRRFQWTVLAKRPGHLTLEAPGFVWFDPVSGGYRDAGLSPLAIDVTPALAAGTTPPEAFPAVLAEHPLDPMGRPARPWAWALAGLGIGAAAALWRGSRRPPADAVERARQREWLRAVGLARGPDFWRAAEEASGWLEAGGRAVTGLRREIAAARYGGSTGDGNAVRRRLVEELSRALPPDPAAWPTRLAALVLAIGAVALAMLLGPAAGPTRDALQARTADAAARSGDLERASTLWLDLWKRGSRAPGLAARLAWADVKAGDVGPAAAWVVRGGFGEARDPALAWVRDRVGEVGGLAGAEQPRWPVRRIEWAAAGLVLAAGAGFAWPRRGVAAAALLLAAGCAAAYPVQSWLAGRAPLAVVAGPATLDGPGLDLAPGQVVRVRSGSGGRLRVEVGRGIEGWLPREAVIIVSAT